MPMHRKNKAPRTGTEAQDWFKERTARDKKRKAMAKASKRANRK